MSFEVQEVTDMRAAWPDIEPLLGGIMAYHRPWDTRTPLEGWTDRLYEFMDSSESVTFLARDDSGRAVGFLNGVVRKDQAIFAEPFAFVNNAFVQADVRSRGVGTELLQRFESWAKDAGAQEMRLHVHAGNDLGVGFWRKAGFETSEYVMLKPLMEGPR